MKRFLSMLAGGLLTVGIAASSADAQVKYTGINIVNGAGSAIFSAATSGTETVNIPNAAGTIYMGLFNGTPFNAGVALFTAGDLVIANGAGNGITRLAAGSNGNLLTITGGVPAYTAATYPATTTVNQILYSSATNVVAGIPVGGNGVLTTNGGGVPSISSTLPTGLTINDATIGGTTSISTSGNIATTGAGTITTAASVMSPSFTNGNDINIAPTVSATIGYTVGVAGGAAGGVNQNGGPLNLNGGAKSGTGLDGVVNINSTTTGATNIGNTTGGTVITGGVSSTGNTTLASTAGTTNLFGNGGGTTTNTIGGNAIAGTTNNNLGVTTNAAGTTVNNIGGGPGTSTINIGTGGGTVTTNLGGTVNFTNAPSLPLANTQIFVGSVLNKAAAVAMSQDATIANDGKVTVVSANGAFTSAGNTTLGTSNTALANSFGTGANANSVINTIGSTGTGSLTNIYGSVANSAHNNIASDNQGVTAANAINWKSSGIGYPVTITNEGNAASNDGLAVKVWRNNADVNAFDVSYNNAVTQGTSLFTVRGDGSINGTNWSVNNAGAITATGFNSTGASTIATGASLTNSFGNGGNTTTNNIGGNGAAGTTTTNNLGVTSGTGITVNNIGTGAGTSTTNIGGTAVFTNIPTVPGGTLLTSATGVKFDVTGTQTSTTAANNLFDVTTSLAGPGNAKGAKITANAQVGGNGNATGLAIATLGDGAAQTSIGLSLAPGTSNGATRIAINLPGAVERIIAQGGTVSILNIKGGNNANFGAAAGGVLTSGTDNASVGTNAMAANTTGSNNTALGSNALAANVGGGQNTAVGYLTLNTQISGTENTAIGTAALTTANTANNNVAMGSNALYSTTSGSNNTAVGHGAGESNVGANVNTTGSNNTFLGYQTGASVASASNLQNATAIGANAAVGASNTIQLGDGNVTEVMTKGKLTSGISGTAGDIKLWDGGTSFANINVKTQVLNTNVYSVPDVGSNANFVMSTGTGTVTFTGPTTPQTYTLPTTGGTVATTTNAVLYNNATPQVADVTAANNLFNTAYGDIGVGDANLVGAAITADGTVSTATNVGSTGLTITTKAKGATATTGLVVSATGGTSANSINATGDVLLNGNLHIANTSARTVDINAAAAGTAGKALTVKAGDAGATGTNDQLAGVLNVASGISTGTGGVGHIVFQTSTNAGATANTLNSLTTAMTIDGPAINVPVGPITVGAPGTTGQIVLVPTGGGGTTITPASGTHSLTLPGVDGQFMIYGPSGTQATQAANGTAYLFNVAYGGASSGNALGGKIDATTTTVNASATALQLTAAPNGSGQATGLAVTITPGSGINAAATFMGGNVGVGNTSPNMSVDITGDLATRISTFNPGSNNVSDANFNNASWIEVKTAAFPTANFNINSIGAQGASNDVSGKVLNLYNNTLFNMTLKNGAGLNNGHRIYTRTGADVVVPPQGTAQLQYDPNTIAGNTGAWVLFNATGTLVGNTSASGTFSATSISSTGNLTSGAALVESSANRVIVNLGGPYTLASTSNIFELTGTPGSDEGVILPATTDARIIYVYNNSGFSQTVNGVAMANGAGAQYTYFPTSGWKRTGTF